MQGLYDERKILMKMSSNEPPAPQHRQAPLQDTPVLSRLWAWTSAWVSLDLIPLPYPRKIVPASKGKQDLDKTARHMLSMPREDEGHLGRTTIGSKSAGICPAQRRLETLRKVLLGT